MSGHGPDTRERWHHRLPHWEVTGRPHFVTIRCTGSLPATVLARVREVHASLAATEAHSAQFALLQRQYFATCEKYLDRGAGFAPFTTPAAAQVVLDAWHDLGPRSGWTVSYAVAMPNHVHFVVTPQDDDGTGAAPVPLRDALRTWKGRVAREANRTLGRQGAFWQESWFDRWLRHEAEFERVADYIRQNPVKAGLVRAWREWPWTIAPNP